MKTRTTCEVTPGAVIVTKPLYIPAANPLMLAPTEIAVAVVVSAIQLWFAVAVQLPVPE